ncbi:MAG: ATP-binding protein [Epsilonproteobacteria bacterium]|nr:ATP-binding protein [Campylobacterota bacterium]
MKCLQIESENLSASFEKAEALISKLDKNLKFKIMLICEEVITNQIRHANFEDKMKNIEFCLDIQDKKDVTLIFKDNAKKFNPLEKNSPDLSKSLEDMQVGGLGIYMIKQYSKSLTYKYSDGYNILRVGL